MTYVTSDLHGEYGLFSELLEKIHFSESDRMIICGDIIDKGKESLRLLKKVFSMPNVFSVLGNHEYEFLKLFRSLTDEYPTDSGAVLERLQRCFSDGDELIDYDTVDALESLPLYIEEDDFICVHSGVPMDEDGGILPLWKASCERLVYDRRFKDPHITHNSPKCVFFGHTETYAVCGENIILGHPRSAGIRPKSIRDFYKVHLDTGAWHSGVMGCLEVETLKVHYVYRKKK